MKAEKFLDLTMQLGEGPVWDHRSGCLHWVDIEKGQVWTHDLAAGGSTLEDFGQRVGMCVPARSGGMVAALEHAIVLQKDGRQTMLADSVENGLPDNRFNDGKCDAAGRLLAGTMDTRGQQGRGSLYILEAGKALRVLQEKVSISNGLGFSPDNRALYYVDTPSDALWRYDYDLEQGRVSGRKALIDYSGEQGKFDGLCVDAEGMLWVAHWGGYKVSRWDPAAGRKLAEVAVPAPYVTSCCFFGEKLDRLLITTARGSDAKEMAAWPLSGALFVAEPGVPGRQADFFGM